MCRTDHLFQWKPKCCSIQCYIYQYSRYFHCSYIHLPIAWSQRKCIVFRYPHYPFHFLFSEPIQRVVTVRGFSYAALFKTRLFFSTVDVLLNLTYKVIIPTVVGQLLVNIKTERVQSTLRAIKPYTKRTQVKMVPYILTKIRTRDVQEYTILHTSSVPHTSV